MSQTDVGTENSLGPSGTGSSVLCSYNRGIYFLKEITEHLFHKSREPNCDSEGVKWGWDEANYNENVI